VIADGLHQPVSYSVVYR